ncbi:FMN-binding protein [Clostridium hydrogeniformans]|uniref:FMN-binding protein n=1 Tax=Clostridium hydrogeniformans TaxID=349933 RepID=UPI000486AB1D|nr:FMN-binding protein [Clostridium hydrogeniformans]
MNKKRVLSLLTASILSVSILAACGDKKEEPKKDDKKPAATATYKDGKYTAEFDKADERGWKSFVEIEVKDGKIAKATFDDKKEDGTLKSKDEGYNKTMKEQGKKTSPAEYTKTFAESLVKNQDPEKIDTVSGATHSYDSYKKLATGLLKEKAAKGETSTLVMPSK